VSVREASCPGCGATLEFQNAATLVVVCPFCGSAAYRTDVDLERIGRVAEVAPILSLLELGSHGTHRGVGWTAVGQLQLDHGAGPWNEWCLLFDDGTWAWLAEAQGDLYLTRRVEGATAPPRADLEPGTTVDLGTHGSFEVVEVGEARVTAARGELPARVVPGTTVGYADLRGDVGTFATLDYGTGEALEAAYAGTVVEPEEVGLDPKKTFGGPGRAEASRVSCPACGGVLELRDPASVRATCGSCGQLLDTSSESVRALGLARRVKSEPRIEPGRRGTLDGEGVEALAFLVRSVTVSGIRYPWREYLLRTSRGKYRWLVENHGHWLLTESVSAADVRGGPSAMTLRGLHFRHFQGGEAVVDHVVGEVYWAVEVGEKVRSDDYVSPPFLLSVEGTKKERTYSLGRYVTPDEVAAGFALGPLPEGAGVAPAQPNPLEGRAGPFWGAGLLMLGVLAVLMMVVGGASGGEHVGLLWPGLVFALALLVPPIVVSTRKTNFEVRRWADSDHPMTSSDDEDDE
jgi:ribosomal protein S27E